MTVLFVPGLRDHVAEHWQTHAAAALPVDVIVVSGNAATLAAKKATSTVPIVSAGMATPVELGIVADLARPGQIADGCNRIGRSQIDRARQHLALRMSSADCRRRLLQRAGFACDQRKVEPAPCKLHRILRADPFRAAADQRHRTILAGEFRSFGGHQAGAVSTAPSRS